MKKPNITHYSFLFALALLFSTAAFGQDEKPLSPPATATGEVNGANITINYSSPGVKGRTIWGDLVPFDKVWRAGANAATTFETDKDIKVEGKNLPAGRYSFFIIPGPEESVFIFNSVPDQPGSSKYDESKDVIRVTVPSQETSTMEERLVYEVVDDGFEIRWEYGKGKAHIE
ncbi:DUF2911 domain-containing protein [Echinicola strongylocentroti]|uniref:DUF2911 domain-containing protein n=1 Tax=Echinicola strongylocentroti TaxID=1795355 RepID=A0A2Z4IQ84_9BACT|nr:DUF2911 domain-containing protein [Echinicola strongylocentroti]AWW32997.1 DUF2911 domain-containing protein [Echinicola strongylocentroti]